MVSPAVDGVIKRQDLESIGAQYIRHLSPANAMVRKDPTQTIVIVLSALLFLSIAGVTLMQRSGVPMQPDPLATYGEQGK